MDKQNFIVKHLHGCITQWAQEYLLDVYSQGMIHHKEHKSCVFIINDPDWGDSGDISICLDDHSNNFKFEYPLPKGLMNKTDKDQLYFLLNKTLLAYYEGLPD